MIRVLKRDVRSAAARCGQSCQRCLCYDGTRALCCASSSSSCSSSSCSSSSSSSSSSAAVRRKRVSPGEHKRFRKSASACSFQRRLELALCCLPATDYDGNCCNCRGLGLRRRCCRHPPSICRIFDTRRDQSPSHRTRLAHAQLVRGRRQRRRRLHCCDHFERGIAGRGHVQAEISMCLCREPRERGSRVRACIPDTKEITGNQKR